MSARVQGRTTRTPAAKGGRGAHHVAHAHHPPKAKKTARKAAAKERSVLAALSLHRLDQRISHMSNAEIRAAVARFEKLYGDLSPKPLGDPKVGDVAFIPLNQLTPGQSQISWDNVRQKMLALVKRFAAAKDDPVAHVLLAPDDPMEGRVAADGVHVEVTDNNHHAAALQALKVIVDDLLAEAPKSDRPSTPTREGLDVARWVFGGGREGVPLVPLEITNQSKRYLRTRDGKTLAEPPKRYSALEDNPFRYLASQLCGKVKVSKKDDDPKIVLRGAECPVWLKVLGKAPDFIEFYIAEVLEAAFSKVGLRYDPRRPTTAVQRDVARWALLSVKDDPKNPLHEVISKLGVVAHDHPHDHILDNLALKNGRITLPERYFETGDRLTELVPRVHRIAKKKVDFDLKLQPGVVH
jgi:hypothetical protein